MDPSSARPIVLWDDVLGSILLWADRAGRRQPRHDRHPNGSLAWYAALTG